MLFIFGLIIILVVLLITMKVKVDLHIAFGESSSLVIMKVSTLFGIAHIYKEVNLTSLFPEVKDISTHLHSSLLSVESIQKVFNKIHTTLEFYRRMLGKRMYSVSVFQWETKVGLGDAASTAVITGLIWTMKGPVLGYIGNHVKFTDSPQVTVQPYFESFAFQTNLRCMLQLNVGKAIWAACKMYRQMKIA